MKSETYMNIQWSSSISWENACRDGEEVGMRVEAADEEG